jgi:dihydrodipicolinate synthase/N-acetylneuraminate lyase
MSIAARSHPFRCLSAFPLTPADPDGRVDAQALSRLLERLCEAKVDSIGLLGSTGIYAYLSPEERSRASLHLTDAPNRPTLMKHKLMRLPRKWHWKPR